MEERQGCNDVVLFVVCLAILFLMYACGWVR